MARTGRRPAPSTTRALILETARRRFAEAGYDATSIRGVAAEVGVDPAAVLHFFGSKDGLFQAAVGWPFDTAPAAAQITEGGSEGIGARVARVVLGYWEDPATGPALLAILRSAMTHEGSATLLRDFMVRQAFSHITGLVGGPQAQLRINLAAAHLIGVAVLRYALRFEPIASATLDELLAWLTPTLTYYLEPESSNGGNVLDAGQVSH